jgi:hypothetical protein
MTAINYNEFMKNAIITHSDMVMNYHNALEFFILHRRTHERQMDMFTYYNKEKFLLFSAGFLFHNDYLFF